MDEPHHWVMSFAVAGFAFLVVLRLARGFAAFKDRWDNIDRPKDDAGAFKFASLDKPERVRILAWSFKGGTRCDQRLVFEIPAEDLGKFWNAVDEDLVIPGYPAPPAFSDPDEEAEYRAWRERTPRTWPMTELQTLVPGEAPLDAIRYDEELAAWLQAAPGWRLTVNFTDVYVFHKEGEAVARVFAFTQGK